MALTFITNQVEGTAVIQDVADAGVGERELYRAVEWFKETYPSETLVERRSRRIAVTVTTADAERVVSHARELVKSRRDVARYRVVIAQNMRQYSEYVVEMTGDQATDVSALGNGDELGDWIGRVEAVPTVTNLADADEPEYALLFVEKVDE